MIPRLWWVGTSVAGVNVDTQATVTLDFTASGAPKVRKDKAGRASARYRLRYIIIQRIGPNTVGGAVLDTVKVGGAEGQPMRNIQGIPFYSGSSPAEVTTELCEWNPRILSVTFTCRSSVASSFQVAAAFDDLGPDPGFDDGGGVTGEEGVHAADVG